MIKFIKNFFLFLGLVILCYPCSVIIYGEFFPNSFQKNIFYEKFSTGFSNTRFKEVKETKNIDILFLGSSRSYRHYDPRIFKEAGYSSFNLGSSGQTFLQTEVLVNRYFDSLNPKYVILDVYPNMFASDGIEPSLDLISNDYNNWETFELVRKTKNLMVFNTWIYALYKEYIWNALNDKEKKVKGVDRYVSGGFAARDISFNNKKGSLKQVWQFNEKQWKSFTFIIEKIKKSSAKLFIVHSPIDSDFIYEGDSKSLKDYLDSQNLEYRDYHDLKILNDSMHFYNPTHLNQKGVDIFDDLIIKDLFK